MKGLARHLGAALLCATLAACHDEGRRQFQLPASDRAAAVAEVQRIAGEHAMTACGPRVNAPGALDCYWFGGGAGMTGVLVREVDARIVVDVGFNTAVVTHGAFDSLVDGLRTGLTRACGGADVTEPAPDQQIPAPRFI